jgi:hypothetical protein
MLAIGEHCLARLEAKLLIGPENLVAVTIGHVPDHVGFQRDLFQVLEIECSVVRAYRRIAHRFPGFFHGSRSTGHDGVRIDLAFFLGDHHRPLSGSGRGRFGKTELERSEPDRDGDDCARGSDDTSTDPPAASPGL